MATPFLFVGSGLSRRYTACEDWEGLLRRFAEPTSRPYDYFRAGAEGDLPAVASRMAEVFHDIWWTDDQFEDSRKRWAAHSHNRQSALKIEIAGHVATSTGSAISSRPARSTAASAVRRSRRTSTRVW